MVFMKKHFSLLITFLIFFLPNFDILADSIAGGKMEMTHVAGDTYKITVTLFVDETFTSPPSSVSGPTLYTAATMPWISIYLKGATAAGDSKMLDKQLTFERKESFPYDGIECVTSKTLATQKIILSTTVSLPGATYNNARGYYIVYQDGNRNFFNNILQSNTTGITLYTEFPNLSTGVNNSPVFKLQRGIVACKGSAYSIDLGATDADGDRLTYFSDTPYSGPGFLTVSNKNGIKPAPRNASAVNDYVYATWIGGFSANNAVPGLTLNTTTGVLSGTPTQEGTFVVNVECREFRGTTQIGVVRQDVEIRVEKCVPPDPIIYLPGGNPTIHLPSVVICEYSSKILETADLVLATYQWYRNGVAITGATKNKLKVLYADAGAYTVEVTRSGTCGGPPKLSLVTQVTQQSGVNVKLNLVKREYCVGEGFIIGVNGLPIPLGSINRWYKNGVLISGITPPADSYPVSNVALKDSGTYRIEVTEIAGNKCVYEDSVKIKVIPIPQAIITNVTNKTSVCEGEIVKLQATKEPGVTYIWVKDGSDFRTADNIDVTTSGTYGLRVENGNCFNFASSTVTIKVNPFPTIRFDDIRPSCSNKSNKIDLRNYVSPYDATGGVFSGTGVSGYEFDPSRSGYGSFPIKYTYKTPEGCEKDASKTAVVDLTPVIKLGNDFTIFRGDTARIKSVGSVGSQYTYEWTPVAGILPSITAPQPLVNPVLSTLYKVKVTTVLGKCSAEDDVFITVRPRLKFANAFTPNNDAVNDTWEIEGIGEYPNAEVTIFNRWGNEMFYSIGYNQSFDGIQKNERLPAGTYFYVIKPSPDVPTLTGYLTIVR
jgi:gliding motility-associated-like protein